MICSSSRNSRSSSGGSRSGGGGCGSGANSSGRIVSVAVVAVAVALLMLSASASAATVKNPPSAAREGATAAAAGVREHKRQLRLMDCGERCESFEIKVFKRYWQRTHPEKHFIDFLRDLVVFSAFYPELKHFKPLVDNAVQSYELCRYVTCSTDYMG